MIDPRTIANFFFNLHHHVTGTEEQNALPIKRLFLERIVVYSAQLCWRLTKRPLCSEPLLEGRYEPHFKQLNDALALYGVGEVLKPISRSSIALSYAIGVSGEENYFDEPIPDDVSTFLTNIWNTVRREGYDESDLFWAIVTDKIPHMPVEAGLSELLQTDVSVFNVTEVYDEPQQQAV